jgi:Tfp pilus assembly protein PilE
MLVAVLVALLAVAGWSSWYASAQRERAAAAEQQLTTLRAQLEPYAAAAKKAFPGDDANTALGKFSQRLDACVQSAALSPARKLAPEQRQAMLDVLRAETNPNRTAWFEVNLNNRSTAAFFEVLSGVFHEAGWQVKTRTTPGITLKPGLFFMAAEENPPAYVDSAQKALEAAGLQLKAARGYRAFYQQQKAEKPGWSGVEMAPDQDFAVIIGPEPDA